MKGGASAGIAPLVYAFLKRVALWFVGLWALSSGIAIFAFEQGTRGIALGAMIAAGAILIVWLLLFLAWGPTVFPALASAWMAGRQGFQVELLNIQPYTFYREGGEWRCRTTTDKTPGYWFSLIPSDDIDLATRLVRVWRAGLAISLGASVVGGILALALFPAWRRGSMEGFFIAALIFCGVNFLQFLTAWRGDGRRPGTIIRHLEAGDRLGLREMAWAMFARARVFDTRPREVDPKWIEVAEDWLQEEPMNTVFRYHALSHAYDTEDAARFQAHRKEVLKRLELHRAALEDGYAELILWYVAFTAETADEVRRIWSVVANPSPGIQTSAKLIEARIAALEGRAEDARAIVGEVIAAYEKAASEGGGDFTYALEMTHRLLESLGNS